MDDSSIIAIVIFITAIIYLIYLKGSIKGFILIAYITICLIIYIIVIKFGGQTGKNYLAIFSIIVAVVAIYIDIKKRKNRS